VVFKKCGMAGHKPDSDKACAAGTCQRTCTDIERCSHAWTLRYWADGKQRERSFKDEVRHERTVYGSGRKLAQVAGDRDAVLDLLTVAMAGLSVSPRRQARMVIAGTLDEAVKAGKLREHRVGGHLRLADARVRPADRRSALRSRRRTSARTARSCGWRVRRRATARGRRR
jgi:hypothetical protein